MAAQLSTNSHPSRHVLQTLTHQRLFAVHNRSTNMHVHSISSATVLSHTV